PQRREQHHYYGDIAAMSANQLRRMFTRLRSNTAIVASATAMALALCAPSTNASFWGGDVVPATSEHDPALTAGLVRLSPSVSPDEARRVALDRKSTRLNSSHLGISYAVFRLKKKILIKASVLTIIHAMLI